jgi:hypothetical protein
MAHTEHLTLADAVDDLARSGFREHFQIRAGTLLALESGETFTAPDVAIRAYRRFEGVSDPDDMAIVYAIESRSGVRGTLVDAFGVYADPAVGDFLEGVRIRNGARARRPVREPFVFGPRDHPAAVGALPAATPRTARYDYGFPAPSTGDPWQDDGGED